MRSPCHSSQKRQTNLLTPANNWILRFFVKEKRAAGGGRTPHSIGSSADSVAEIAFSQSFQDPWLLNAAEKCPWSHGRFLVDLVDSEHFGHLFLWYYGRFAMNEKKMIGLEMCCYCCFVSLNRFLDSRYVFFCVVVRDVLLTPQRNREKFRGLIYHFKETK